MDGFPRQDVELVQGIEIVPKILESIRHATGMRFVALARVTEDRWTACAVQDHTGLGLKVGDEIGIHRTLCTDVEVSGDSIVIDHASRSSTWRESLAAKEFRFESFCSFPVRLRDGTVFGTLCALDPAPRQLNGTPLAEMIEAFADVIGLQIADALRLDEAQQVLRDEKAQAELREQFIAVLGHDLRNPVASVLSGCRLLLRMPLGDQAEGILRLMQGSAVRMNGLIDNLLDFARGRLGDGIAIDPVSDAPLRPVLMQVIDELRSASDRGIDLDIDFAEPIHCDPQRIGQLLSNLLGNAIAHGARDEPVRVEARREGERFVLSVVNGGDPIPVEAMEALFLPFSRSTDAGHRQGLGLGLFIAAEIARGHGGTLTCLSNADETRFTLDMRA